MLGACSMLRIIYSLFRNLTRAYLIPWVYFVASHPDKFTIEQRYKLVRHIAKVVAKTSRVKTTVHGTENLPDEGGYVMFPNHQGKYDVVAVVVGHSKPCSLVMDYERSNMYFVNEIMHLLEGKRLKRNDVRQAMKVIMETATDTKEGQRYILFPEGGYDRIKENSLYDFKPGAFKTSLLSETPIVPVVLYNTYKVFNRNSIRKTYNEVHYLDPIPYDEFKNLKTIEIAELVKERIRFKLEELDLQYLSKKKVTA